MGMRGKGTNVGLCDRFIVSLTACCEMKYGELNQTALSKELGMNRSSISDIKRHTKEPSKEMLARIVSSGDIVDATWLLTGSLDQERISRMRQLRLDSGLSEESFGERVGIPAGIVRRIEQAEIVPSDALARRIERSMRGQSGAVPFVYADTERASGGALHSPDDRTYEKITEICAMLRQEPELLDTVYAIVKNMAGVREGIAQLRSVASRGNP